MRIKLPRSILEFLIFFFVIVAFFSLHQLHQAGQPILGTIVDSFGIAAMVRVFSYVLEKRYKQKV